jgi:hypothetical protein
MPEKVKLLKGKLNTYLTSVDAQKPEDSGGWQRVGRNGKVRTHFFKRYYQPDRYQ